MRPVQILLADDHEVVRKGLRALLEAQPGWKVIAEAMDGREAVEKARDMHPDVAIVDIGMPCLNGLEATRQIVKKAPRTRVLVLTMHVLHLQSFPNNSRSLRRETGGCREFARRRFAVNPPRA
jgi:DNA-binding NarL/FixJ family response regulator